MIARGTPGFSGADLANLVNEAALLAARRNKRVVTQQEFEDSKDKVMMGAERRSMIMTEEEKLATAYHEGGHALVNMLRAGQRSAAQGHDHSARACARRHHEPARARQAQLLQAMVRRRALPRCSAAASRSSSIYGEDHLNTGASSDIMQATELARRMVTEWGMSEQARAACATTRTSRKSSSATRSRSARTCRRTRRKLIDEEIRRIVTEGEKKAREVLFANRDKLEAMTQALMEYETINGEEVHGLMRGEKIVRAVDDPGLHTVLVVDHGLRLGSADEARAVADRAAGLGFRHAVLAWQGDKPRTGIQAAARVARYRLMGEHMSAHGIGCLLTAHTRDDQAETLLMRLARGSGVDGLAAMAPWTEMGARTETVALRIVRPLLSVAKARLRATLEARGVPWVEDPSNWSAAFERTRWRAARADLEGLGLSSEMLASSARRLQRARAALEAVTDAHCAVDGGLVETDPCGVLRIDREQLRRAPEEIALRVIARCIVAAGGSGEPVPLAGLEPIVARIWCGSAPGSWTLARAQITAGDQIVQVEREPGRLPLPVLTLTGGARERWDGRFAIEIAEGFEGSLELRALGNAGLAELRRLGQRLQGHLRTRPCALLLARKRASRCAGHRILGPRRPEGCHHGRLHGAAVQLWRRCRRPQQRFRRALKRAQKANRTGPGMRVAGLRGHRCCGTVCLANILYTPMLNVERTSPSGGAAWQVPGADGTLEPTGKTPQGMKEPR